MAHLGKVISIDAARNARKSRGPQERPKTKAEVAEHFSVSVRTIDRWMTRGMPYEKPFEGGSVRFNLSACEEWFRRLRRSA